MKVIYIEDDQQLALFVSTLLKRHGYEVVHFSLGKAGLESFSKDSESWDAVILDLELPDVPGHTLIPAIYAQRPALPVIVYSGEKQLANRFELYSLGASAVVSKPCGAQDLLDILLGLIEIPPMPVQ
jgi:DNA-binding response OmpR family regulator